MSAQADFRKLVEFPTDYMFKAFGPEDPAGHFATEVHRAVNRVLPVPLDALRTRPSRQGRYACVTVLVRLHNQTQLNDVYLALKGLPNLLYLL